MNLTTVNALGHTQGCFVSGTHPSETCEFGVQLCPKDPSLASRLGKTCRALFPPR